MYTPKQVKEFNASSFMKMLRRGRVHDMNLDNVPFMDGQYARYLYLGRGEYSPWGDGYLRFENCTLSSNTLPCMISVTFSNCYIDHTVFEGPLQNVHFRDCVVRDSQIRRADTDCTFTNSNLTRLRFHGMSYHSNLRIENCVLHGTVLRGFNIGVTKDNSYIAYSDFEDADLSRVNEHILRAGTCSGYGNNTNIFSLTNVLPGRDMYVVKTSENGSLAMIRFGDFWGSVREFDRRMDNNEFDWAKDINPRILHAIRLYIGERVNEWHPDGNQTQRFPITWFREDEGD